jgi:hypothetical protein
MQLPQTIDKYVLELDVNVCDVKEQEKDYNYVGGSQAPGASAPMLPLQRKSGWQVEVANHLVSQTGW